MHAERCPICSGTGVYVPPPNPYTREVAIPRTCHGCQGKGWVSVEDIYYPHFSPTPSIFRSG